MNNIFIHWAHFTTNILSNFIEYFKTLFWLDQSYHQIFNFSLYFFFFTKMNFGGYGIEGESLEMVR